MFLVFTSVYLCVLLGKDNCFLFYYGKENILVFLAWKRFQRSVLFLVFVLRLFLCGWIYMAFYVFDLEKKILFM